MALSELGKLIERMQAEQGLDDARLAREAKISRQNLSLIKRGQRPWLSTIHKLAKALDANVDIFLAARD